MSKKPSTRGGILASPYKKKNDKAGKGLVICEVCDIYNYKKSWHHGADDFVAKRENKDLAVSFSVCPACEMIKGKKYGGKVSFKNVPVEQKKDLLNLVKGYCDRAFDRDPLDRLIDAVQSGSSIVVTVTKNQLAQRLAKKAKDAFNKVKVSSPNLHEPGDVANFTVEFL